MRTDFRILPGERLERGSVRFPGYPAVGRTLFCRREVLIKISGIAVKIPDKFFVLLFLELSWIIVTIPYVKRFILPFPVRYLHFFSGIVRRGVAFDVAFRQIPEDRARTVPDTGPYFLCSSASVEVPGYRQGSISTVANRTLSWSITRPAWIFRPSISYRSTSGGFPSGKFSRCRFSASSFCCTGISASTGDMLRPRWRR